MKTTTEKVEELFKNEKFLGLDRIGGHKIYHLEGSALIHTKMVVGEAKKMWGVQNFMVLVAALHDIGKLYTSVEHGPGDWTYPGHAAAGAEHLGEFISPEDPDFEAIKWYIKHHIKPLFWNGLEPEKLIVEQHKIMEDAPEGDSRCNLIDLARLALCDIRGSITYEIENPAEDFLERYTWQVL